MQRFALLLGLITLSITLGLLWRSEDARPSPRIAELEIPLTPELEQLLSKMPPKEREEALRRLNTAYLQPRSVRVIQLNERPDGHGPFLFPTDQMYREIPQREVPFQRR